MSDTVQPEPAKALTISEHLLAPFEDIRSQLEDIWKDIWKDTWKDTKFLSIDPMFVQQDSFLSLAVDTLPKKYVTSPIPGTEEVSDMLARQLIKILTGQALPTGANLFAMLLDVLDTILTGSTPPSGANLSEQLASLLTEKDPDLAPFLVKDWTEKLEKLLIENPTRLTPLGSQRSKLAPLLPFLNDSNRETVPLAVLLSQTMRRSKISHLEAAVVLGNEVMQCMKEKPFAYLCGICIIKIQSGLLMISKDRCVSYGIESTTTADDSQSSFVFKELPIAALNLQTKETMAMLQCKADEVANANDNARLVKMNGLIEQADIAFKIASSTAKAADISKAYKAFANVKSAIEDLHGFVQELMVRVHIARAKYEAGYVSGLEEFDKILKVALPVGYFINTERDGYFMKLELAISEAEKNYEKEQTLNALVISKAEEGCEKEQPPSAIDILVKARMAFVEYTTQDILVDSKSRVILKKLDTRAGVLSNLDVSK